MRNDASLPSGASLRDAWKNLKDAMYELLQKIGRGMNEDA